MVDDEDARELRLADGRAVVVRAIRPGDREAFLAFQAGLSDESRYQRYFSPRRRLPERELRHYLEVDDHDHAGVVALVDGELVGHALYDHTPGASEAEVALEVADAFQGHGVGTALLGELVRRARSAGIRAFAARVLPENRRMLQVFRDLGFRESARFAGGLVLVRIELAG